MAKAVKVLCDRCENKIIAGVSFCDHCSCPTRWATHEERTTWEVSQWKTADRSHAPKAAAKRDRKGRRWNPFSRKQEPKPALSLVPVAPPAEADAEPAAAEPNITIDLEPAPVVIAAPEPAPAVGVAPAAPAPPPERQLGRPKKIARARPEPAPAVKPAQKLGRGAADDEPATDTPATIMAMRLLNARVRELDERIQRLEHELEDARQPRRAN